MTITVKVRVTTLRKDKEDVIEDIKVALLDGGFDAEVEEIEEE